MSRSIRIALICCVLGFVLGAPNAFADVLIQLKDGTAVAVPVSKENVVSITFTESAAGLINAALSANGGKVVSGFTGWGTPAALVIDGQAGPDDMQPTSTARDNIAAYSVGAEPFQISFRQLTEVRRIGIMHKFSGGAGGRDIVERARLTFSDGSSQEVRFAKTYSMQTVEIAPRVTTTLKVEQLSFYPGNDRRWGVIEFEVWGTPR
ncbi:MAG: hypothetical protein HY579_10545 [Nitrospinae bacterium]|nr:hypothetical protein [Nitrospinota bacterium]